MNMNINSKGSSDENNSIEGPEKSNTRNIKKTRPAPQPSVLGPWRVAMHWRMPYTAQPSFDDFDDYKNRIRKAIETDNKDFFEFKEEVIKLCEKYKGKLDNEDIIFILQNIAMNPPNDWNKKK